MHTSGCTGARPHLYGLRRVRTAAWRWSGSRRLPRRRHQTWWWPRPCSPPAGGPRPVARPRLLLRQWVAPDLLVHPCMLLRQADPKLVAQGCRGGDAPWVGEGGREQMEVSAALHWGLEGAEGGREGRRRTRLEREEILVAFGEGG